MPPTKGCPERLLLETCRPKDHFGSTQRTIPGDTLLLAPVLTKAMVRKALADPKEFSAAGWAVSMAYPGHPWKRVPCQSWC
jgi:hypothetical protein